MATELGQAYIQIIPSARGISGAIQSQLNPEALAAGKTAGTSIASSIASSLGDVGQNLTRKITLPATAAVTAVGGIVAAFGWKRLTAMDSAQAQLKGLGYAVQDVERISGMVKKAVQGTTMTMAEGTSVAAGALAAGVKEGADLERYIKLVGDAAVGANRPISDMAQIFNRVQGSGKLMTKELNMIEQGMPGFAMAMSDALGTTQAEFREMVTAGEVSSEQFLTVMEDFAGEMSEAYAKSWEGMVSNTKAWVGIIGETMLGGVFEQSKESIGDFMEYLKSDDVQRWAKDMGATIGEVLEKVVESVKSAIEWWGGLSDGTKKLILNMAALAVAMGPVLTIAGKLISAIGLITTGVGKVTGLLHLLSIAKIKDAAATTYLLALYAKEAIAQAALTVKTIAMTAAQTAWNVVAAAGTVLTTALGAAIAFLTSPIGIVIAAIIAIIAVGVLLYKNWDVIKEKASQLASWLKDTWQSIKEAITALLDSIKNLFSSVFNSLKGVVSNAFSNVKSAVQTGMANAYATVTSFFEKFKEAGRRIVTSIADGIRGGIDKVKAAISDVAQTVRDYLPFSPAKEGPLKDLGKLDFTIIADGINNAKRPIESAMKELAQLTLEGYDAISDINGNITHRVTDSAVKTGGASPGGNVTVVQHIYSPSPDPRAEQRRAAREFKKLALGV